MLRIYYILVLKMSLYRRNYCHYSYEVLEAQRGCELPECTKVIGSRAVFTFGSVVQECFSFLPFTVLYLFSRSPACHAESHV